MFILIKFYTGICLFYSYRVQCHRYLYRVHFSELELVKKFIVNKLSYSETDPASVSCVLPVPDTFCNRSSALLFF